MQEPDGRYYNVARLIGPGGPLGAPYRKVHLVPFGEYVPLAEALLLRAPDLDRDRRVLGGRRPVHPRPGGRASRHGRLLRDPLPEPRPRGSRPRAARTFSSRSRTTPGTAAPARRSSTSRAPFCARSRPDRYLLRAAITGISGIVDEKGRIRERAAGRDRPGSSAARRASSTASTVWTQWGYGSRVAAEAAAAAVLVFGLVRWLRGRRSAPSATTEPPKSKSRRPGARS